MEQTFWEKIKRVKIKDIFHIFKFMAAWIVSRFLKGRHKDLWLFCDTENEARDNGYWLYKYVRENHKEQEAAYAINFKSPDFMRVCGLGKTIPYGSFRHWLYYLMASKNISSQKMGKPNAAVCYLLEVYGIIKNTRIFLQHGIITANLTFLYYPHTKMRLFVCSTQKEWKYVNDNYGYPAGWVQKLGLCRFDQLHDFKANKKQILIMPTWRMYIRNEIHSPNYETELKKFRGTRYFQCWNGLLHHKGFVELVEKNGLQAIFYPHREMHRFLNAFQIDCPNITVASWPEYDVQELLKSSACLITDFSSVAMDFAYMKKPLVYYQFDTKEFRESHHGAGDFDFKSEGFGPVCQEAVEVVEQLERMVGNGFQNESEYLGRHAAYFDLWDDKNCERNYEAIKNIT